MHVGIATDHGGFRLKEDLLARLRAAGHDVVDFGASALDPDDDYPDSVIPLAQAAAEGRVERGIAVCGDEQRGEDPTVNTLQQRVAELTPGRRSPWVIELHYEV